MQLTSFLTLSAALVTVAASPINLPLPDGFPNPSPAQFAAIEKAAGGTIPNGPMPPTLKPNGTTILKLLALNEIFEVVYFSQLLSNITENVPGYDEQSLLGLDRQYVIDTISTIVKQEEAHAVGINGILTTANQTAIQPCKFQTPVTSFAAAIKLAQTFTDIVLGALPLAQTTFADDAGTERRLIQVFGSVQGQEGEQVGFFRSTQKKVPSAAPFLSSVGPSFSFSALKLFIVPDSCPQPLSAINIPTFPPLTLMSTPEAKNSTLTFTTGVPVTSTDFSIVYLSGQNSPVTVPIATYSTTDGMTEINATFPYDNDFAAGLTIAALVPGTGQTFMDGDAVAAATIAGPGLIEVA